MRARSKARQLALELVYQLDLGERPFDQEAQDYLAERSHQPEVLEFASGLAQGCWQHREEIDRTIANLAEHWELSRIATIDRNILRLGAYELIYRDDIPRKVSINEAVELAKRYSTGDSGAFVNGILDKINPEKG